MNLWHWWILIFGFGWMYTKDGPASISCFIMAIILTLCAAL